MNNFESNLEKLEKLTADIKRSDISLEDALKDFEEGIKLAKGMEKQLDDIEGKVQILMNEPAVDSKDSEDSVVKTNVEKKKSEGPQLDLFAEQGDINGTRR